MVYKDYDRFKKKYHEAQNTLDSLLVKKESTENKRQLRQINQKIRDAQSLLSEREELLNLKEQELKNSNEPTDRVYYYRYIEKLNVKRISKKVHYSETQVYRFLTTIRETLTES